MARLNRAMPPPAIEELLAHYSEHIGETMPGGLIPPDLELQWLGQLLFGSATALEHPYRVQSDVEDFLQMAPQGHFAIGFWGHGIQSHAFYLQRVEPWCRIYLRIPYGGIYSNHGAQALSLHQVLLWLPEFLRDANRYCRHLRLVDSMGDGQLKLESNEGEGSFFHCSVEKIASKGVRIADVLEAQTDHQLQRWLME